MSHRIGKATVEKVWETDLNGFELAKLLPGFDAVSTPRDWLPAGTIDGNGNALMSIHVWLVRLEGRVILVDTGAGNDKPRPQQLVLDNLQTDFLARLRGVGVGPADVTHIVHTHIHSDHVGWDTRLADGEWVPAFPNAEIIVSDLEYRYGEALTNGDGAAIDAARREAGLGEPVRVPVAGTFADSVRPLEGRVAVRRVAVDGGEVLPGVSLLPTPGHSIDHASIMLRSGDEVALFSGDVFHHPVEVYDTELVSVFCEFPEATRASRRRFLERAAGSGAVVFSSHFPLSSAGRVERRGDAFGWTFIDTP